MKALKVSGAGFVDARGRPCPWPIIELAKALKLHAQVELWADDPAARADVESFCAATGARHAGLHCEGALLKVVVSRQVS